MHLTTDEIKKLLKNWHFYRMLVSTSGNDMELKRKLDAVERSLVVLDDVSRTIIQARYFDKTEMNVVVEKAFMARSAVYKRIDKALAEMSYVIANTA